MFDLQATLEIWHRRAGNGRDHPGQGRGTPSCTMVAIGTRRMMLSPTGRDLPAPNSTRANGPTIPGGRFQLGRAQAGGGPVQQAVPAGDWRARTCTLLRAGKVGA
jgi:hypothetical protein